MDTVESLNQSVWDCKYHVVFIPKCRRKALHGDLRQHLGKYSPEARAAEGESHRGRPPASRFERLTFECPPPCRAIRYSAASYYRRHGPAAVDAGRGRQFRLDLKSPS